MENNYGLPPRVPSPSLLQNCPLPRGAYQPPNQPSTSGGQQNSPDVILCDSDSDISEIFYPTPKIEQDEDIIYEGFEKTNHVMSLKPIKQELPDKDTTASSSNNNLNGGERRRRREKNSTASRSDVPQNVPPLSTSNSAICNGNGAISPVYATSSGAFPISQSHVPPAVAFEEVSIEEQEEASDANWDNDPDWDAVPDINSQNAGIRLLDTTDNRSYNQNAHQLNNQQQQPTVPTLSIADTRTINTSTSISVGTTPSTNHNQQPSSAQNLPPITVNNKTVMGSSDDNTNNLNHQFVAPKNPLPKGNVGEPRTLNQQEKNSNLPSTSSSTFDNQSSFVSSKKNDANISNSDVEKLEIYLKNQKVPLTLIPQNQPNNTTNAAEKVSGSCQTGASIINGETTQRTPIDLPLFLDCVAQTTPSLVGVPDDDDDDKPPDKNKTSTKDHRRRHRSGDDRYLEANTKRHQCASKSLYVPEFTCVKELLEIFKYCRKCKQTFENRKAATHHQKMAHNLRHCPVCYVLLSIKGNVWKDHLIDCHSVRDKEMAKCMFCEREINFEGMYTHMSIRHFLNYENDLIDDELTLLPPPPLLSPNLPTVRNPHEDVRPSTSRHLNAQHSAPPKTYSTTLPTLDAAFGPQKKKATTNNPILNNSNKERDKSGHDRIQRKVTFLSNNASNDHSERSQSKTSSKDKTVGSDRELRGTKRPHTNTTTPIQSHDRVVRSSKQHHSISNNNNEQNVPNPTRISARKSYKIPKLSNTAPRRTPSPDMTQAHLTKKHRIAHVPKNNNLQPLASTSTNPPHANQRSTNNPGVQSTRETVLAPYHTAKLNLIYTTNKTPDGIQLKRVCDDLNLEFKLVQDWFQTKYKKECQSRAKRKM